MWILSADRVCDRSEENEAMEVVQHKEDAISDEHDINGEVSTYYHESGDRLAEDRD